MKRVLLLGEDGFGICEYIYKNLKKCGFDVIFINYNSCKYSSIWECFKINIGKFFCGECLKQVWRDQYIENYIAKVVEEKVDYTLCINSQIFSIPLLKYIKSITLDGNFLAFHWDGLNRFSTVKERIHLFNRFYVFDPHDKSNNTLFASNFYFDIDLNYERYIKINKFYYLGSYNKNRHIEINKLAKKLEELGYESRFDIISNKKIDVYPSIHLMDTSYIIKYEEYLENVKKSDVLVDFINGLHLGLSYRIFEALAYDKKIITTNKDIKYYEFYHPDNIFILDNNYDELNSFLQKPYHYLDSKLKEKYSFTNWIRYVFQIEPYQEIPLPKFSH